jgi:hypothetical protein
LIGQDDDGNYLSERVKNQLLPNFKSLLRDPLMAEKFTPVLLEISDLELDRIEREKLREFRYVSTRLLALTIVKTDGLSRRESHDIININYCHTL